MRAGHLRLPRDEAIKVEATAPEQESSAVHTSLVDSLAHPITAVYALVQSWPEITRLARESAG